MQVRIYKKKFLKADGMISFFLLIKFVVTQFCVVLQKAFDSFAQGKGYITPEMVGTILRVMGQAFNEQTLKELIAEVDTDGKF